MEKRLLKQYEGATFFPPNPANNYVRGNRHRGMEPMKDLFGTEILWPQEQLAAMPHVTEGNKVIDDITEWKSQVKIPDIVGQCSDPATESTGDQRFRKSVHGIYADRSV